MAIVVKEGASAAPPRWKQSGLRMHPEVRRSLRAVAVLEGVSMPELAHGIFVEWLRSRGYVARLSGEEVPA
jgi:hypothetical protein